MNSAGKFFNYFINSYVTGPESEIVMEKFNHEKIRDKALVDLQSGVNQLIGKGDNVTNEKLTQI